MYKYITHTSRIHCTSHIHQTSHTVTESSVNFFFWIFKINLQTLLLFCRNARWKVKKTSLVGGIQELQSQAYMYNIGWTGKLLLWGAATSTTQAAVTLATTATSTTPVLMKVKDC